MKFVPREAHHVDRWGRSLGRITEVVSYDTSNSAVLVRKGHWKSAVITRLNMSRVVIIDRKDVKR